MYSIPAYYLGRLFSQICVQVFYPFIIILIVYFGIHGNNEFGNVALLLLYGVFINVTMVCQAFFFGTLSDNFMAVEQFHIMPMLLFMLTAGTFVNSASMPTVISYFSYINPLRYAVQGFFLRFVDHVRPLELRASIISSLGFDEFGHTRCLLCIAGAAVFYIIAGILNLMRRSRKL